MKVSIDEAVSILGIPKEDVLPFAENGTVIIGYLEADDI
jgi:hypothetical protein